MFKGLKAKIEVEQRTQSSSPTGKKNQSSNSDDQKRIANQDAATDEITTKTNQSNKPDFLNKPDVSSDSIRNLGPENLSTSAGALSSLEDSNFAFLTTSLDPSIPATDLLQRLREEVINLRGRLSKIVRERDQCNIKNEELQNSVRNLTNELTAEKAINQTLQNKLNELSHGSTPSNKTNGSSDLGTNRNNSNISIKPFNPTESLSEELKDCNDVEQLRNMVLDISRQVTEKNRQLKIRMQNLNDIKKALQKELFDHSKTQDELHKLQASNHSRYPNNDNHNQQIDYSSSDQNNSNRNANSSDNSNNPTDLYDESDSATNINQIAHRMIPQLDGISCHSSASVDESDGNMDPHSQKDVNHEYLRNVLFRYMTSTDAATTLHLVKALSVLMNFTPEQSTAIRKTMNARNSWLRLPK